MMDDVRGLREVAVQHTTDAVDVPVAGTFDAFYRARYAGMVRLAYSLVDTVEQAEEVVQDAFAGLYDRYERVDDPVAYVRRSVVNGCRQVHRRRRLARRRPVPAPEVATDLVYNHLLDAIARLPLRQRAVVVLRYEAGLDEAEIAATLGIPAGTVKSRLARAKDRLREEIER